MDFNFPIQTFHLLVPTFQQHHHMGYISVSLYDIPNMITQKLMNQGCENLYPHARAPGILLGSTSLKIPKGSSEAIHRRIDITIWPKEQTIYYKTLHRKLMIEQYEPQ
jgi:hypothetical protein